MSRDVAAVVALSACQDEGESTFLPRPSFWVENGSSSFRVLLTFLQDCLDVLDAASAKPTSQACLDGQLSLMDGIAQR